jgi:hypothetical protein
VDEEGVCCVDCAAEAERGLDPNGELASVLERLGGMERKVYIVLAYLPRS